MNNLDILSKNRNNLLLAEAIGWLHDYFKCSDEHLLFETNNEAKVKSKTDLVNLIISNENLLKNTTLSFQIDGKTISSKINLMLHNFFSSAGINKIFGKPVKKDNNDFIEYLSRCHYTAHFDKQEPLKDPRRIQTYSGIRISSPFGFERNVPTNLTKKLKSLPWNYLINYCPKKREILRREIEELFSCAIADTRRPINEVDLWSWGLLVGSLYKSALAGDLLKGEILPKEKLKWRLLSVRVKGLEYMLGVTRIPDLLARKRLLEDGFDRVKKLLEVEYPLGSEIYRDENGSIYVVPDLDNLLEICDAQGYSLRELITTEFKRGTLKNDSKLQIGGEIKPDIQLEDEGWWGQDPEFREKTQWEKSKKYGQPLDDKLPKICPIISSTPMSKPDLDVIEDNQQWKADVCTVCGLRQQGPSKKSAERSMCNICEKRRSNRSKEWVTEQPEKTIWTEEVADANGRLALLMGQFDLTHWLDGTFLETIFVISPKESNDVVTKTASPSRLRRMWETTRLFWQEVQKDIPAEAIGNEFSRLKICIDGKPDLGDFHVYSLALGPTELDIVWVPSQDKTTGYFITAANLSYIAHQLGAKELEYSKPSDAAWYVKNYLEKLFIQEKQSPILSSAEEDLSQGKQNLLEGNYITEIIYQEDKYTPVIPILAEPSTFMMLVPADKSLQMTHLIKNKYEREMAKVRDRLPIKLGIIYAERRMPIRSILDAGRAMLSRVFTLETWQVKENDLKSTSEEIKFSIKNKQLLKQKDSTFVWGIPTKMGDKITDDYWYPYFSVELKEGEKRNSTLANQEIKAKMPLGQAEKEDCQIVYAADLNPGERINLLPSIFDFEFLDTNARRFELYYDQEGRRPCATKPYYLEDIDRFFVMWHGYLKHLSKTQCKQLVTTIETVREQWFGQDDKRISLNDEVFFQFVADTLAGAFWPEEIKWNDIPEYWQRELIRAGVCGELTDLVELHLEILKE